MLCYNNEDAVFAWSKEHNDAVMDQLMKVQEGLKKQGCLGSVARLMPTSAATTLRKQTEPPLVIDGPLPSTRRCSLLVSPPRLRPMQTPRACFFGRQLVDERAPMSSRNPAEIQQDRQNPLQQAHLQE